MSTDLEAALSGAQPEPIPTEEPQAAPEPEATPEVETPEAEPLEEVQVEFKSQRAPEPAEDPVLKELQGVKTALAESRAQLRELKQASQPKPEPIPRPDVLEDPEGFARHQDMAFSSQLQNVTLNLAEDMVLD